MMIDFKNFKSIIKYSGDFNTSGLCGFIFQFASVAAVYFFKDDIIKFVTYR